LDNLKILFEKINEYDNIIIQSHANPDGDAIGSSIGLKELLAYNYPNKNIFCISKTEDKYLNSNFDIVNDDLFKDSLIIITDVAVDSLLDDHRYQNASYVVCIDHHTNPQNLLKCDLFLSDSNFNSACSLIAFIGLELGLKYNEASATPLYLGLISDSGRFLYMNETNARLSFIAAQVLIEGGADFKKVYNSLYVEKLYKRLLKNHFQDFKLTEKNIAYRFNYYEVYSKLNADFFYVSRGTVNIMSGIEEVPIWANFTEKEDGSVIVELRSRDINIVDVAKKYGGGGHANACGATIKDFDEAYKVLEDLEKLL